MFCEKCGKEVEERAKFCGFCGKIVEDSIKAAQKPNLGGGSMPRKKIEIKTEKKKANNKLIVSVICVVVAVALIAGAFYIIFKDDIMGNKEDSYKTARQTKYAEDDLEKKNEKDSIGYADAEKVLENFINASTEGDIYAAIECTVIDMDGLIKEVAAMVGMTKKEFEKEAFGSKGLEDYYKETSKEMVSKLKEEYGSNYKISFKILDTNKLNKDEMQDEIDKFESSFGYGLDVSKIVKLDKIKEMVEYEVAVKIRGSKDESVETETIQMAKIDGQWLVLMNMGLYN